MGILFLKVCLLKQQSYLKAGERSGKLFTMFYVKGEWQFMYKQV